MSGLTSIDGLISGLNTSEIIDAIMAVERRSVTLLQAKRERFNTELLSYQSIEARLLAVRGSADALARASTFDSRMTTSSDTSLLTGSAAARSAVGTYDLTVSAIARSHQVASQGFADIDTTSIGTGTFTIEINGVSSELTIDAANSTLSGLRDAINRAGVGVQATIINDGGSTTPNRLLLTSTSTGTANRIAITSSLEGGTEPVFDANSLSTPVQGAANFYSGTASSGGEYTGTSGRNYLVKVVQAGGIGEATFKVSEDGGRTWGNEQTLTSTIDVFDDISGSNLGAQMNFSEGEFAEGDTFAIRAFVPTVQEAQDAVVHIGSGAGRIEITSASNRIVDALPGVTLNLVAADPARTVRLEVKPDVETARAHITNLVANFNSAVDYITQQSGYDERAGAGIFLGNSAVMNLQANMRNALLSIVPGTEKYNSLFSLGLSVSDTGSLSINTSRLDQALADNYSDVAKIFGTTNTSTNSKIIVLASSSGTRESVAGYDVDITQAATRGVYEGTEIADPAVSPLTINSTNRQLMVTVNGVTSGILQLTEKTYTSGAELATEIQRRINADPAMVTTGGVMVQFVDEGETGYFTATSNRYGSTSTVAFMAPASNANSALGFVAGTATNGTNVSGTINGEPATGNGQILNANRTNPNTAGISLRVTLTPEEILEGSDGKVSVVKGVGTRINEVLNSYTDPVDGLLKVRGRLAETQISDINKSISRMEDTLAVKRQRLVDKYNAMESALAAMQQQLSYLGLQFDMMMAQKR